MAPIIIQFELASTFWSALRILLAPFVLLALVSLLFVLTQDCEDPRGWERRFFVGVVGAACILLLFAFRGLVF